MKRKWLLLISLLSVVLLLAACNGSTAPTSSGTANTPVPKLGDNVVKDISAATQSGNFHTPLDSTPSLDGSTIYFTASSTKGPGVFSVQASGGPATPLFTGSPFVTPTSIALAPDGKQLYITDPGASGGRIFALSVNGGSPSVLKGSVGTAPQNLNVVSQSGQQLVYFTGKDPVSHQVAVLTLPTTGANAPTIVYKGSPLDTPDGIVVASSGAIYVADRSAAGSNLGKVFKIQGSVISVIVKQVRTGKPAGIAFSPDESVLLISSLQPNTSNDQVLLVDLNSGQLGTVTRVVGQNHSDAGGLHASPGQKNIFSWCGVTVGGAGTVYRVELK